MKSRYLLLFSTIALVLMISTACALPFSAPGQILPSQPPATSATPTPETPTSLPEESATLTPTPGVTALASPTLRVGYLSTDTPTPTLEPVTADVLRLSNCRTGPGQAYDLVASYPAGTQLLVLANDLGGGYLFVQDPQKTEDQCYILTNNLKISGDASVLPKFTPLPSPTAVPNFTPTFKKFDLCKSQVYAQFTITNIGSLPFLSAYIKVTNTKNGESVEKVVDAFDLTTGCIIAKNIAPLNAGATGYLSSDVFKQDPRGNILRAVIQVCTEKGLGGICVNKVLEIRP